MNLFEPPPQAPTPEAPLTVQRVAASVVRGAALGAGAAGAIFALEWFSAANEGATNASLRLFVVSYVVLLFAPWLWKWGRRQHVRGRRASALVARVLAVIGSIVSAGYLAATVWSLKLAAWFTADVEFATLVAVCGVVGAATLWMLLWQQPQARARVSLWFVAAATLWLASEWSVRLGPRLHRFEDPRYDIATFTVFGAGVLLLVGVVALMDWHIRWRDRRSVRDVQPAHNGAEGA